jgi:hypothetical protein
MEDCPTIKFRDIKGSVSRLRAFVWRRSVIASQLRMTESQLIEAALLLGNDFTSPFPLSEYTDVPAMSLTREQVIEFIKSRPTNFQLSSMNPQVQLVLEYSRDFYRLADLSHYPFDAKEDAELPLMTRDSFIDSYDGQLHPSDRKDLIANSELSAYGEPQDLSLIISTYLGDLGNSRTSGNPEENENSEVKAVQCRAAVVVSPKYQDVLAGMVESCRSGLADQDQLERSGRETKKSKRALKKLAASIDVRHSWEDIVVLDQYERLLKLLLRHLLSGLATESAWRSTTIRYDRINHQLLETLLDNQVKSCSSFLCPCHSHSFSRCD